MFHDDVVRMVRIREAGATLSQSLKDVSIH